MEGYGDRFHYFTWVKPGRKGIKYQQRSHYRKSWKQVAMCSAVGIWHLKVLSERCAWYWNNCQNGYIM